MGVKLPKGYGPLLPLNEPKSAGVDGAGICRDERRRGREGQCQEIRSHAKSPSMREGTGTPAPLAGTALRVLGTKGACPLFRRGSVSGRSETRRGSAGNLPSKLRPEQVAGNTLPLLGVKVPSQAAPCYGPRNRHFTLPPPRTASILCGKRGPGSPSLSHASPLDGNGR